MSNGSSIIGVDFGGENLRAGVVVEDGDAGRIVGRAEPRPTRGPTRTGQQIAEDIVAMVQELHAQHPDLRAVGIGSPGIVDVETGEYRWPPCNVPHWDDAPANLKSAVTEALGLPCFVNNDAQVFAAGEQRWGSPAARNSRCMLFLTLGTGIGGALRVGGKDFQGARNTMEIGHSCVDFTDSARPCGCGLHGCAEAYASNTALAGEALRYIRCGRLDPPEGAGDWAAIAEQVDARWVYDLAKAGHPVATRIVARAHQALAMLIANFANTVSVDLCVLAGGITNAGDFLFRDVQERVDAHALPTAEVAVRPAALKEDMGILGAGAFALERLEG